MLRAVRRLVTIVCITKAGISVCAEGEGGTSAEAYDGCAEKA